MNFVYDKDHPVFEGHFPGHPVVPAAALLAEAVTAAHKALPERRVVGVVAAKFFAPLGPEMEVDVDFNASSRGLGFRITNSSTTFAEGTLLCEDHSG